MFGSNDTPQLSTAQTQAGPPTAEPGEEVLREHNRVLEALRLNEERFRIALGISPVIVFNQDRELRYTWIDNRSRWFTGREQLEQLIGRADRELLDRPEDASELDAVKRRVLESGSGARQEIRVISGGRELFYDLTVEPLRGESGEIVGVTCAAVVITEHLALEAKLREQAARLAEADRRKDEFLAMLAHELRNPLAPIRNAVQILTLKQAALPSDLRWVVEAVARQTDQLAHLVDDLLDVARITRGHIELVRRPVSLEEIVTAAVEAASPCIEARAHTLTVDLPPGPVHLEADGTRLAQVLANLLNNAAKYTEDGGHIRLCARASAEHLEVQVEDDGIGIAPGLLPRIFDLFVQADRSLDRSQGGLGLGLTLVRRLVELHGGSVEANSPGLGGGSTFVVRLPGALISRPSPSTRGLEPEQGGPGRSVLVVDDNADSAETIALLLRLSGHRVHTAHDGHTGLELARTLEPEVVILDIGLPRLSGYEVAQQIRARAGPQPMLVALTGYGQESDRRRCLEAGFDHHLLKPLEPGALEALVPSSLPST